MKNEQYYRAIRKLPGIKVLAERRISKLLAKNKALIVDETLKLDDLSPDIGDRTIFIERDSAWDEKSKDISIIVPVYNTGEYLRPCLESALKQETTASYEVILVDDGSTDKETEAIILEYEKNQYDNLVVIRKENGGLSDARNKGISNSCGKYLMFLDSDDCLCSNALELLYNCATENNADIAEGAYENVDETGKILTIHPHVEGVMDKRSVFGYTWGKLYRANLFKNKQFPKGYWYEDSIIKPIIACLANKIVGIGDTVYLYRRNRKSISFTSQKSYKCLDAYYIAMLVHRDRKRFMLPNDQFYYEELLNIIRLTYRRTLCLPDKYKILLFDKWCDFIKQNFLSYHTKSGNMQKLEKALKDKNYNAYDLWCKINIS